MIDSNEFNWTWEFEWKRIWFFVSSISQVAIIDSIDFYLFKVAWIRQASTDTCWNQWAPSLTSHMVRMFLFHQKAKTMRSAKYMVFICRTNTVTIYDTRTTSPYWWSSLSFFLPNCHPTSRTVSIHHSATQQKHLISNIFHGSKLRDCAQCDFIVSITLHFVNYTDLLIIIILPIYE